MKSKIRWITETAVMLALLICLQWVGVQIPEPLTKQLVTGSFVNAVLAVTVLMVGYSGGITVALISPVVACYLKIAPNPIAVLPIMLGNTCFVVLLRLIVGKSGKPVWKQPIALLCAAGVKFALLYTCGVLAVGILGEKLTAMLEVEMKLMKQLSGMFSWPQLVTALIGGTLALLIVPALRKALHR